MKKNIFYLLLSGIFLTTQLRAQQPIKAPFELTIKETSFPDKIFSIEDFGAKKGGKIKCTQAFSKAIEKATKTGGGYVTIPKGKWLTGAIVLKTNVCLKLEEGAEVVFSTDHTDYLPAVLSRHQGIDCFKHSAFIYADNATNIGIIGKGTFYGQGMVWMGYRKAIPKEADPFKILVNMAEQNVPLEKRIFNEIDKTLLAPCFIMPINCENILIDGITVRFGAYWTVNPVYCKNIIIRNTTVVTIGDYGEIGNGDGINLSSCNNVLVENCILDTGDDCITIKSGRGIDGYKKGIPSENIVVRNCKSLQGHGGVVIGSETSGGIRNIYVHDCEFNGTDRGLRIKTARGRGDAIENVWFENIKMGNMKKEVIKIHIPRYTKRYPAHKLTRMTPRIRNINYKNIECEGSGEHAIRITGIPEMPVESVLIENIKSKSKLGILAIDAASITMNNLNMEIQDDTLISFDNCSNINIEKWKNAKKKVIVKGAKSSGIRFIDCEIGLNNIQYVECQNKVKLLTSK